jgi:eukaryotic-like serine/threonine-protein kinase
MTGHPVLRVDISNLPVGEPLGSGGQGRVVTVAGFLINGQWPAALKIYSRDAVGEMDPAALEEIVALPRDLSPDAAQWLYDNTAWPAVIVEDGGAACGFLMRVVPPEFSFQFRTQTQGTRQKLADVAFLLNSDEYVSRSGLTVSEQDRLALLGTLAQTLSRLHDLGIYVGDLSPKNLLFSLGPPQPGCFILDCDAMRVRGQTVLKQVHTPDWEVPDGEPTATAATDAYKFGLLAIRLFARDQTSRDRGALAAISPALGQLAELSQDADPSRRPPPGAWITPLGEAARRASAAPATASGPVPAVAQGPAAGVSPAPDRIAVPMPTVTDAEPPAVTAQPTRTPGPRPRRRGALIVWGLAGLVVIGGGAAAAVHALDHSPGYTNLDPSINEGNTAPAGTGQAALSSPSAIPTPTPTTSVGQVTIGNSIISNPQAASIASLFNTYFTGINDQDYSQALSAFAPDAPINPTSSSTVESLAHADSTTQDSNIVLNSLYPSDGGNVTKANITFQSTQQPGYGPDGASDQTCTDWNLNYTITQSSGNYYLYQVKGTDTGC